MRGKKLRIFKQITSYLLVAFMVCGFFANLPIKDVKADDLAAAENNLENEPVSVPEENLLNEPENAPEENLLNEPESAPEENLLNEPESAPE